MKGPTTTIAIIPPEVEEPFDVPDMPIPLELGFMVRRGFDVGGVQPCILEAILFAGDLHVGPFAPVLSVTQQ